MKETIDLEILGSVNVYIGLGFKMLVSIILGCLIGMEREVKNKAAGVKTNILICLGATLYTAMSLLNLDGVIGVADPNRTAAQVVSGIGFLGAGTILQSRGAIIGLTTAATIWVVAAVGVTIGMGFPGVAIIFTITVLTVLRLIAPIYNFLGINQRYLVEIQSDSSDLKRHIENYLQNHFLEFSNFRTQEPKEEFDKWVYYIYISATPNVLQEMDRSLSTNLQISRFTYHKPMNTYE